jgi:hypothetical protein
MQATPPRPIAYFLTGLGLAIFTFTQVVAQDSPHNKRIFEAIEPLEVLAEAALTGKATAAAKAFKTAHARRATARALISQTDAARFDELFVKLEAAVTKHDRVGQSLQAAELYKLLVSSLDTAALTGPIKEVHLLDYVGFRITALLQLPAPDWLAIAATTKEANSYWATIRGQVGDSRLRGRMDEAQKGIATGAERHDVSLTRASVKKNLDLVDELEGYFSRK